MDCGMCPCCVTKTKEEHYLEDPRGKWSNKNEKDKVNWQHISTCVHSYLSPLPSSAP